MIGCSIDGLKHPRLHLQLTLQIMPSELKTRLQAVDAAKAKLDRQRPLPPNTVSSLREKLMLEWTYHSNAIEGNTLTLRETKVVLEGITVGGKSLREHLEATNHRDAIVYVEDIVAKQEDLNEWQIKNIHSLIMKGIDQDEAGRYRRENVVISGASTTPPDFLHIDREMQQLIQWHERSARVHVIERAAELHARFVKIHPFVDGNGRTGRLLMNFELMKEGYPPAVIRKEDQLAYYDALDEACLSGDHGPVTSLVADAVLRSLEIYNGLLPQKMAGTLAQQWQAVPGIYQCTGSIVAMSASEIIQDAGDGKHVVWDRHKFPSEDLELGKDVTLHGSGKVVTPGARKRLTR